MYSEAFNPLDLIAAECQNKPPVNKPPTSSDSSHLLPAVSREWKSDAWTACNTYKEFTCEPLAAVLFCEKDVQAQRAGETQCHS
jgi:hypothetical protein